MASLNTDAPWFCFMNPDSSHSSCHDLQENYWTYEKLALKYQLKYIASDLTVGTLVWVKTARFARLYIFHFKFKSNLFFTVVLLHQVYIILTLFEFLFIA